jgi:hypothetical protein
MLRLEFEGFFQCRLTTDPDPTDETRGVSGWTFAVAPEPDLDRVIRLQHPVALRSKAPAVGVNVVRVISNDQQIANHPLLGARVDLHDAARFEGHNGIVAEDALEPIDPFLLEISGDGVLLRREDFWDAAKPQRMRIVDVDPGLLARRQPLIGVRVDRAEFLAAVGVSTTQEFTEQRRHQLGLELADMLDPDRRAGLEKRISDLSDALKNGPRGLRQRLLGFGLVYEFEINGPDAVVEDPTGRLHGAIDASGPWPIRFWMGGFDADALCGFMRGSLTLPFSPA